MNAGGKVMVSRKFAASRADDRLTDEAKSLAEIWGYLGEFGAIWDELQPVLFVCKLILAHDDFK